MLRLSSTRHKSHKYAFNGISRDSIVSVAPRIRAGLFGFRTAAGVSNFSCPETSRPHLGPSRPLFNGQLITGLFPRGKVAGVRSRAIRLRPLYATVA
jgi:hypothetical protein